MARAHDGKTRPGKLRSVSAHPEDGWRVVDLQQPVGVGCVFGRQVDRLLFGGARGLVDGCLTGAAVGDELCGLGRHAHAFELGQRRLKDSLRRAQPTHRAHAARRAHLRGQHQGEPGQPCLWIAIWAAFWARLCLCLGHHAQVSAASFSHPIASNAMV
jgi:hypothetical protein